MAYQANLKQVSWTRWREFFEQRKDRPLPRLDPRVDYAMLPRSVARSLAVFQLGESGGGTIVDQARNSSVAGVDADYVAAIDLFVKEEHRHANILAMCVRMMHGELVSKNWTAKLFVFGRRLIGLRLKVLVLLAAEVVGICYYSALADRLPGGPMRQWLRNLVEDERSHLHFHCEFLRMQASSAWRRRLFVATWRSVIWAAAVTVMIDHRETLRDLRIERRNIWDRWMAIAQQAEHLVTRPSTSVSPVLRRSSASLS